MALRKLAGPFYITNADEGALAGAVTSFFWVENVGLVLMLSDHYGMYLCSIDGVAVNYNDYNAGYTVGYNLDTRQLLECPAGGPQKKFDRRSLMPLSTTQPLPGLWLAYFRYLEWRDRKFGSIWNFPSSTVQEILPNGSTEVFVASPFTFTTLKAGRRSNEAFAFANDGTTRFCFLDMETKEFTTPKHTGVPGDAHYLPEYGIILVVNEAEGYLTVLSLEAHPTAISAPQLIAGENKAGFLATYRVRVTDDDGDPCQDEVLTWSLSGKGRLLNTTSTTDDEGYATVRVRYGLADDGDAIVTASLVC